MYIDRLLTNVGVNSARREMEMAKTTAPREMGMPVEPQEMGMARTAAPHETEI